MAAPPAPWSLSGECLVTLVRRPDRAGAAGPARVRLLPGWVVIVAASYDASPVGGYRELAVGQPARFGRHVGLCVTTMVVDSPESRRGGRDNWGFPKELGALTWHGEGGERSLRWEERGLVVRGRPTGPAVPVMVPVRAVQELGDTPVVVPGRLRAAARPARVTLEAPADDALGPLAGARPGCFLSGLRLVVAPPRPTCSAGG